jgi:hypothetical protein
VQLTASLSHPNTVSVFDYGRTPDGIFYYAMEYLEGTDLDALVRAVGTYLVTGTHVFGGTTTVEVCSHHLHTQPEPPSQRLGQTVPGGLEQMILACLEKDPARRPASAAELADLDDLGPVASVSAGPAAGDGRPRPGAGGSNGGSSRRARR